MFSKVNDAEFITGEHSVLKFWNERHIFQKLRAKNAGKQPWSFLDGPITANNPMGVHHAWGRTYKDSFQRYWAMNGRDLRYQNGFDCQGLWVEVEVEKQLGLGAKSAIEEYGIDKFVQECKRRVLKYAAIQTEQSVRLGYWMEWDSPEELRKLASAIGSEAPVTLTTPKGITETAPAEQLVSRLGNPDWGGSYFTFSTENNETIWTFLKNASSAARSIAATTSCPGPVAAAVPTARWKSPTDANSPPTAHSSSASHSLMTLDRKPTKTSSSGRRLPGPSPATSPP